MQIKFIGGKMVTFTRKEILGTRGYHAAETVLLDFQKTVRHTHEFYEIFLIEDGEVRHYYNQQEELLTPGTLCLIWPEDIHCFQKHSKKTVRFLNIAFSSEQFVKGCDLWETYYDGSPDALKNHTLLPLSLSQSVMLKMLYIMNYMVQKETILPEYLVQEILVDSLIWLKSQKNDCSNIPLWLEQAYKDMAVNDNHLGGIPRFVELSGKSQEYLTRMMKKYYKQTPSAYLNELRLRQAASLIRTTNTSILDIMLECGFSSVSYFNQRFREYYGISPSGYRKLNRMRNNPS